MMTQRLATLFGLILLMAMPAMGQQVSSDALLKVKPSRCVALREGQVCYQRVVFSWDAKTVGDYCLYEKGSKVSLKCWHQVKHGKFKMDFQSVKSVNYRLVKKNSSVAIAAVEMIVAWVYKSSKRPRSNWRLF